MIEESRRVVEAEPSVGVTQGIGGRLREVFDRAAETVSKIADCTSQERKSRRIAEQTSRRDRPDDIEGVINPVPDLPPTPFRGLDDGRRPVAQGDDARRIARENREAGCGMIRQPAMQEHGMTPAPQPFQGLERLDPCADIDKRRFGGRDDRAGALSH